MIDYPINFAQNHSNMEKKYFDKDTSYLNNPIFYIPKRAIKIDIFDNQINRCRLKFKSIFAHKSNI